VASNIKFYKTLIKFSVP